jgi:dTDP-4-dehydrorhamnose 3,5-epimerase
MYYKEKRFMRFEALFIEGAWLIQLEPVTDHRGDFTHLMDIAEFNARGLTTHVLQQAVSTNKVKGTLRGMHYQAAPHAEAKLVRCVRGALFDVIVDNRPDSPTYLKHYTVELCDGDRQMLYIPPGCAHGFLTLEDNSAIEYRISQPYVAEAQRGLRYDDPKLAIAWPGEVKVISERDKEFALL